jgi:hypothetical protein
MNIHRRYASIVELEFRSKLLALVERYCGTEDLEKRFVLKKKIGEINRRIIEAKEIWERFAPWDT